jgi:hypothetical protein
MESDFKTRLKLIEELELHRIKRKTINDKLNDPTFKDYKKKNKLERELYHLNNIIAWTKEELHEISKNLKFLTVPNSDTSPIPTLNISEQCKETDNMVSQEPLIPGETVLLSDGHCYSLETAVNLYESYIKDIKEHKKNPNPHGHVNANTLVFKGPLRDIYNENDIKLIQKAKIILKSLSKKRKGSNNKTNKPNKNLAEKLRRQQEELRSRLMSKHQKTKNTRRNESSATGSSQVVNVYQARQIANMEQAMANTRARQEAMSRNNTSRRSSRTRRS